MNRPERALHHRTNSPGAPPADILARHLRHAAGQHLRPEAASATQRRSSPRSRPIRRSRSSCSTAPSKASSSRITTSSRRSRTRGDSAGADRPAGASRHAGAAQPRAGRLHRLDPGPRDRRRQRARAGERHALRQPREGDPVAVGGRRGPGARRRADGAVAAPDGPRPRARSVARRRRHPRRSRRTLRLCQPVACRTPSSTAFVEALAMRIASFDKQAIAETKRLVDVASLPPDAEIKPEWDAFLASLGRPAQPEPHQGADGAWLPSRRRRREPAWLPRGQTRRLTNR